MTVNAEKSGSDRGFTTIALRIPQVLSATPLDPDRTESRTYSRESHETNALAPPQSIPFESVRSHNARIA